MRSSWVRRLLARSRDGMGALRGQLRRLRGIVRRLPIDDDRLSRHTTITPSRLRAALADADRGWPDDFFEIADEVEDRWGHYQAAVRKRRMALTRIRPVVNPAGDEDADAEVADAVRSMIRRLDWPGMVGQLADAIPKGYAAVELLWETGDAWTPSGWREWDQRWLRFRNGGGLLIRTGLYDAGPSIRWMGDEDVPGVEAANPLQWIVWIPSGRTGPPMRRGIARTCAWLYLVASYGLTDWLAYGERFGHPLLLGRYGPSATPQEISTLDQALGDLGSGGSGSVPESMRIEMMDGIRARAGSDLWHEQIKLAERSASKVVLGQTMTSDDGSSLAQAAVHQDVERDITEADATQLEQVIQHQLVEPFVAVNRGTLDHCPTLSLPVPDPERRRAFLDAVKVAVPMGVEVGVSTLRRELGLPEPQEGDPVLRAPATVPGLAAGLALAAARPAAETEADIDALAQGADAWRPTMEPMVARIRALAERADSGDAFLAALPGVLDDVDDAGVARALAAAAFRARGLGDATD